ncbi:MAG: PQQ-binding-like beta-propeller repeat protein [Acidimicrobiia bacterium]
MDDPQPLADEVEGVASIASPVPVAVLAEVLGVPESEIVDTVEVLEGSGRVGSTRQGVTGYESSLSSVRMTHLASRLADSLQRRGAPLLQVGRALLAAGDAAAAHQTFTQGLVADNVPAGERFELVDRAIESGREARIAKRSLAPLLVERARQRRGRGENDLAVADLDAATPHLEDDALVDAYGFAAQLHDDAQRPADAERTIAMALLVAARGGMDAKLGSLLTFQGRLLARLGFEAETERVFSLGGQLVAGHGDETQRHYAALNKAWTDLDRGWAARAEGGYSAARARAVGDDPIARADLDIAIARAKFTAGDAAGATALLASVGEVAAESQAPVLRFLSTLALAEGAITFHQRQEAVDAATELRAIVEASFPPWRNRAATVEARALLLAQRPADAREAIRRGFETTPHGANGLRLRTELEALALMADERWDEERATDVADRLLQGGWLLTAVGVLTERARRENRPEFGRAAAALAHRIGAAPAAAEAIEAANAWDEPAAGPVVLAMRRVAQQVPEEWREQWLREPAIAHALATEATAESATDEQLLTHLDAALDQAGLAGRDVILSPAQRRAAGFVSSGSTALSIGRFIAWVAAAAVVAAIVAIALRPEPVEPPTATASDTTLPATTTTTTPPIMERIIPLPADFAGQVPFAGGDTRNARFDASLGEPTGVYWTTQLTGFVRSDPVLRGRGLYIGDSEGWFYGLDIALEGAVVYESRMAGAIDVSATAEQVVFGQDDQGKVLTFGGDDRGNVLVRHVNDTEGEVWTRNLGSPITGPPLVRAQSMIVATADGVIFDLLPSDGTELRRFPEEGNLDGGFTGPLAADGTFIYARTAEGAVVVVDEATLTEVCTVDSPSARAVTHVVVDGNRWYVGTSARTVRSFGAGGCSDAGIGSFQIDTPVAFAPVFTDGVMWAIAHTVVLPIDVETGQTIGFVVSVGEAFTSPPVIAGDIMLLTTEADDLIAVSTEDGSELWRFPIGSPIRNRPVVANDLVLIATARGEIIAIAAPGP